MASKRIVLGVCGSIAAYKACEIVRGLVRADAQVKVVMTPSAARFITPLTLSVLSRGPVHQDAHDPELWDMAHLSLSNWADMIVTAPATADFMARLAAGRAGGLLEAVILSCNPGKTPVVLCPAMDSDMWEHPATRENARRLKEYGYSFWGPDNGPLASGRVGPGRLMEPDAIVSRILGASRPSNPRRERKGGPR